MARTFADTLAADVTNAFFDPNGFGQAWVHVNPAGESEPFVGFLDEDAPQPGQGGSTGETTIRTGLLSCPLTIDVSVTKGKASHFTRNGETWIAVGLSQDDGVQEVRVVSNTATHLRGGRRSGVQS